jgi:hypothetical protein
MSQAESEVPAVGKEPEPVEKAPDADPESSATPAKETVEEVEVNSSAAKTTEKAGSADQEETKAEAAEAKSTS